LGSLGSDVRVLTYKDQFIFPEKCVSGWRKDERNGEWWRMEGFLLVGSVLSVSFSALTLLFLRTEETFHMWRKLCHLSQNVIFQSRWRTETDSYPADPCSPGKQVILWLLLFKHTSTKLQPVNKSQNVLS